jgi:hypothetical protein
VKKLVATAYLVIAPCISYAETFGSWMTGVTDTGDGLYAATQNDSGNLLGQYCFPSEGNCIWLLGMATACKEGDQYAVLANSDAGAGHLNVYCSAKLDNGLYRYVFLEFDAIQNIVTKGMRVGFAVPLEGDQFRVVRFDLGGSNRALAVMRSAAEQIQKQMPSRATGTRDQNL